MIVVNGHLTIDPAQRDTALDAIRTLVAATRAEEGNLEYGYSADIDDENRIVVTELWADQAAMDSHMATEHMAAFLGAIGPCIAGDVSIVKYDVAESTKLF